MTANGIRTLRKQIHGRLQVFPGDSNQAMKAFRHLCAARMWLGEALIESGASTHPYPNSLDEGNDKIDTEADQWEGDLSDLMSSTKYAVYIKQIRNELVEQANRIRGEMVTGSRQEFYQIALRQAYIELTAARMWLGRELRRIANIPEGWPQPSVDFNRTSESPE